MLVIYECSTSAKTGISPSEERKKIASFILAKSIPVSIDSKDSVLGVAIQGFITDTLKANGYRFIINEEREVIYKKYFDGMFGGSDTAKVKAIAEKL